MNLLMNYNDFLENVRKEVLRLLPKSYSVKLQHIVKNNNVGLDSLFIQKDNESLSPNIYLNDYYDDYKAGRSVSSICNDIWSKYLCALDTIKCSPDIPSVYKNIHERLILRLVSYPKNKKRLESLPHSRFDDLAVTYHILVSRDGDFLATLPVTYQNLETLPIDISELHSIALKNTIKMFPAKIRFMEDILYDAASAKENDDCEPIRDIPADHGMRMFVLTNSNGVNGAACILYQEFLDEFEQKYPDFYILPSSIHEVILLPKSDELNIKELTSMVKEVNAAIVEDTEILSDHAYLYSELKEKLANITRPSAVIYSADVQNPNENIYVKEPDTIENIYLREPDAIENLIVRAM